MKSEGWALGGLNRIGNKFMPVFDYDTKYKDKVIGDIMVLQEKFGLNQCCLYKTKRGFHVKFYWNLVSWKSFEKMLDKSKCDKRFKILCKKLGQANLRLAGKHDNDKQLVELCNFNEHNPTEIEDGIGELLFALDLRILRQQTKIKKRLDYQFLKKKG